MLLSRIFFIAFHYYRYLFHNKNDYLKKNHFTSRINKWLSANINLYLIMHANQ